MPAAKMHIIFFKRYFGFFKNYFRRPTTRDWCRKNETIYEKQYYFIYELFNTQDVNYNAHSFYPSKTTFKKRHIKIIER